MAGVTPTPTEALMVAPGGLIPKECEVCGGKFGAKRDRARFCSPRCQMRHARAVKRGGEPLPERREGSALVALPKREERQDFESGLLAVTHRELDAAGRVDTPMGQATLLIARLLDSGIQDTGSSIAALVRQYDASLTKALDGAVTQQTPLERIRGQRRVG